jgi:hypothetical protein
MSQQTEGKTIPQLPETTSAAGGDFLVLQTAAGTRKIQQQNLPAPQAPTVSFLEATFEQQLTQPFYNTQAGPWVAAVEFNAADIASISYESRLDGTSTWVAHASFADLLSWAASRTTTQLWQLKRSVSLIASPSAVLVGHTLKITH